MIADCADHDCDAALNCVALLNHCVEGFCSDDGTTPCVDDNACPDL